MPEVNKNSDDESVAKKPKQNANPTNFICESCPVLQVSISQLQEDLTLKTSEWSELLSHLCSKREFFELEKQSAKFLNKIFRTKLDKIFELEKQLLDFQQKDAILQGELLDVKKELKLCKLKFAGKCSTLRKASKPCEDKDISKEPVKIIANEHPNDIIDVTQHDFDSNLAN